MKWLICGGRAFRDMAAFASGMNRLVDEWGKPTLVIHGAAPGADTLADIWARTHGFPIYAMPANWSAHGRSAGPIRNRAMLQLGPHAVIAWPGGSGTEHMVRIAESAGVPVVRMPLK